VRGIGIDAVDIAKFRRALERTPSLRQRVFTADELVALGDRDDVVPGLAARFAAREATMKVLGVGIGAFDLHDVSIQRLESGRPTLIVTGRAASLAAKQDISTWHVSLTHTDTVAMAVVSAD
jgi:holo-[acyl-carrier protein] synthase